jgi:hypothetical protein
MLDRGACPVEAFRGTQHPWRSKCLVCGNVSAPRYNDAVNKGTRACNAACRSQKISKANRRDPAEAKATMLTNGWEVLEDYPGAGAPWRARCVHRGSIYRKEYAHVEKGRASCRKCTGRDVTDSAARQLILASGLEPLVPYPGSLEPWLQQCLRSNSTGMPT